ncbi:magnesium/cobalt transporter CorA [Tuwongella immobilis]|uniref:Magnesium transport protein CorA n=1 Tax=Tuwongella immobilis TaxID=692036 RepID=A0A6C2YU02_9BACT|nr:magnesium/cobalt transporter CorA [Tuwongella immobilis]VIP04871.1 magnesium and cobalt transport protein : Magnesium and cobalt transport protein CorA OS=Herpetosiphon aurantiacus (strain ATCC 23779 / DSM 785) GN=Haur_4037 PE=4 SV=1: CorA [Tuwongella immobilis]VTS07101.1 magnesium and cobalt transport protein : Magnesium and cobalt transport protein CorA OS=Herpetosiphon aurantiacus (strain ATCC 23779 / DSM 785) GN=Haur_4037 PE=4 SV=1: CorA [Tuwongella immobilis]
MIRIYRWDQASGCGRFLQLSELPTTIQEACAEQVVWWIDLENPTTEEEARIYREFLPIHPLTIEDITRIRRLPDDGQPHLPKVEEFRDYLFVITNPIPLGSTVDALEQPMQPTQLSAVLTRHVLITHHYMPLEAITSVVRYLERHDEQGERGPDYLFHLILDVQVDGYAPLLDRIVDELETIEESIYERTMASLLNRLLQVKRRILGLRKTLILEREVLARLNRGEFQLVDAREVVYYRNVYDHLVRYTELIESGREMVTDLMQSHMTAISNRLNEIMKVLAMISTVVLPMTLVAGIYGMNFEHMPELHWTVGYPLALSMMATLGIGSFVFFRWKKWI